jgi:hypothetical protein
MERSRILLADAPCSSHAFVALTASNDFPKILALHSALSTSVDSAALNPIPRMASDAPAKVSSCSPRFFSCLSRSRLSASSERNLWRFASFAIRVTPELLSAVNPNPAKEVNVRRRHDFSSKPLTFSPREIKTSVLCSSRIFWRAF